jgi:hypothetical protein
MTRRQRDRLRDAIHELAALNDAETARQLAEFINGPDSDAAEASDVLRAINALRAISDNVRQSHCPQCGQASGQVGNGLCRPCRGDRRRY